MSGPDLDMRKPNVLGGLDRLATDFGLAVIAVIPTFFTCIFRPSRLRPLIDNEAPDGRRGYLLSPGVFFFLSLLLSFIFAAMLSTPETLNYNGSYISPGLAVSVQTAASEGNIWKLIGTIMPIYGAAVVIGLLGAVLTPFANGKNGKGSQKGWSLRVSVRAAFYVFGALVSWIMLTTAIIDLVRLRINTADVSTLYVFATLPALVAVIWIYAGFFREEGAVSWSKSIGLALAMVGLIFALMVGIDLLVRM